MTSLPHPLQNLPLQRDSSPARALPRQRGLALERPGWPATPPPADTAKAATRFEELVIQQLLASARKASFGQSLAGDTPFSSNQEAIDQQVDRQRAALIARAAPLGVGRLLAAEAERTGK